MRLTAKEITGTGRTFTVLLDGKDVSNSCFAFDTIEGWVDCFVRDKDGKLVVQNTFEVSEERLYGDVSVTENVRKEYISVEKEKKMKETGQ